MKTFLNYAYLVAVLAGTVYVFARVVGDVWRAELGFDRWMLCGVMVLVGLASFLDVLLKLLSLAGAK